MINKLRLFALTLFMGVVFMLLPFSFTVGASATSIDPTNPKITLNSYTGVQFGAINDKSGDLGGFTFLTINTSTKVVTVNMVAYNSLSAGDKKELMKYTLESISNMNMSRPDKIRLYNFVAEQDETVSSLVRQLSDDVKADFVEAYSWFRPFSGTVSTILGLISIIIFIGLSLTMVVDLAFISIPAIRLAISNKKGEAQWVSKEAEKAIKFAESDPNTYHSAVGFYFKHKTGQIFILGVCLVYLVGGKIYDLVGWIIDAIGSAVG